MDSNESEYDAMAREMLVVKCLELEPHSPQVETPVLDGASKDHWLANQLQKVSDKLREAMAASNLATGDTDNNEYTEIDPPKGVQTEPMEYRLRMEDLGNENELMKQEIQAMVKATQRDKDKIARLKQHSKELYRLLRDHKRVVNALKKKTREPCGVCGERGASLVDTPRDGDDRRAMEENMRVVLEPRDRHDSDYHHGDGLDASREYPQVFTDPCTVSKNSADAVPVSREAGNSGMGSLPLSGERDDHHNGGLYETIAGTRSRCEVPRIMITGARHLNSEIYGECHDPGEEGRFMLPGAVSSGMSRTESWETQLFELREMNIKLETMVNAQSEDLRDKDAFIAELEARLREVTEVADTLETDVHRRDLDRNEVLTRLEQLSRGNDTLMARCDGLHARFGDKEADCDELKQRLNAVVSENIKLHREKKLLEQRVCQHRSDPERKEVELHTTETGYGKVEDTPGRRSVSRSPVSGAITGDVNDNARIIMNDKGHRTSGNQYGSSGSGSPAISYDRSQRQCMKSCVSNIDYSGRYPDGNNDNTLSLNVNAAYDSTISTGIKKSKDECKTDKSELKAADTEGLRGLKSERITDSNVTVQELNSGLKADDDEGVYGLKSERETDGRKLVHSLMSERKTDSNETMQELNSKLETDGNEGLYGLKSERETDGKELVHSLMSEPETPGNEGVYGSTAERKPDDYDRMRGATSNSEADAWIKVEEVMKSRPPHSPKVINEPEWLGPCLMEKTVTIAGNSETCELIPCEPWITSSSSHRVRTPGKDCTNNNIAIAEVESLRRPTTSEDVSGTEELQLSSTEGHSFNGSQIHSCDSDMVPEYSTVMEEIVLPQRCERFKLVPVMANGSAQTGRHSEETIDNRDDTSHTNQCMRGPLISDASDGDIIHQRQINNGSTIDNAICTLPANSTEAHSMDSLADKVLERYELKDICAAGILSSQILVDLPVTYDYGNKAVSDDECESESRSRNLSDLAEEEWIEPHQAETKKVLSMPKVCVFNDCDKSNKAIECNTAKQLELKSTPSGSNSSSSADELEGELEDVVEMAIVAQNVRSKKSSRWDPEWNGQEMSRTSGTDQCGELRHVPPCFEKNSGLSGDSEETSLVGVLPDEMHIGMKEEAGVVRDTDVICEKERRVKDFGAVGANENVNGSSVGDTPEAEDKISAPDRNEAKRSKDRSDYHEYKTRSGYHEDKDRSGYHEDKDRSDYHDDKDRPGYHKNKNRSGYHEDKDRPSSLEDKDRSGYYEDKDRPSSLEDKDGSDQQEDTDRPGYHEDKDRSGYHEYQPLLNYHEDQDRSGYHEDKDGSSYHGDKDRSWYHEDKDRSGYHGDKDRSGYHEDQDRLDYHEDKDGSGYHEDKDRPGYHEDKDRPSSLEDKDGSDQQEDTDRPGYHEDKDRSGYHEYQPLLNYHEDQDRSGYHEDKDGSSYHGDKDRSWYHEDKDRSGYHGDKDRSGYHEDQERLDYHEDKDGSGYHEDKDRPGYHEDKDRPGYHEDKDRSGYHGEEASECQESKSDMIERDMEEECDLEEQEESVIVPHRVVAKRKLPNLPVESVDNCSGGGPLLKTKDVAPLTGEDENTVTLKPVKSNSVGSTGIDAVAAHMTHNPWMPNEPYEYAGDPRGRNAKGLSPARWGEALRWWRIRGMSPQAEDTSGTDWQSAMDCSSSLFVDDSRVLSKLDPDEDGNKAFDIKHFQMIGEIMALKRDKLALEAMMRPGRACGVEDSATAGACRPVISLPSHAEVPGLSRVQGAGNIEARSQEIEDGLRQRSNDVKVNGLLPRDVPERNADISRRSAAHIAGTLIQERKLFTHGQYDKQMLGLNLLERQLETQALLRDLCRPGSQTQRSDVERVASSTEGSGATLRQETPASLISVTQVTRAAEQSGRLTPRSLRKPRGISESQLSNRFGEGDVFVQEVMNLLEQDMKDILTDMRRQTGHSETTPPESSIGGATATGNTSSGSDWFPDMKLHTSNQAAGSWFPDYDEQFDLSIYQLRCGCVLERGAGGRVRWRCWYHAVVHRLRNQLLDYDVITRHGPRTPRKAFGRGGAMSR